MQQLQKILICFILAFCIMQGKVYSQSTLTPQNLFDINTVVDVSISPDKSQIAYILNVPRPFNDRAGSDYRELHLYNVRSEETTMLIGRSVSIFSLGWTPDGKSITFRANFPDHPGVQVYAFDPVEKGMTLLTKHSGSISTYEFIDQNTLAIVSMSGQDPGQARLRELGFDIEVYEEEFRHLNLYRYNLTTHQTRQLTDGVTVFDFVLSPDKKTCRSSHCTPQPGG
jgi:Tol biopolymer transport system component